VRQRSRLAIALTIAGSDSGGGAGIQADLKTFFALGVHGTSAITCLTAQNPRGVIGVQAASPAMVRRQIEAVFEELPPSAVKTGMLYSKAIIEAVAEALPTGSRSPVVVDPVMVATSGARLLQAPALHALTSRLLSRATLVTPNVPEAEILAGLKIRSVEDLRKAARRIQECHGCAVVVKGGHLRGGKQAVDIFREGSTEFLLEAPVVRGVRTHGTGCMFSAAITARLAVGDSLMGAIRFSKTFLTGAILWSQRVARHTVLNPVWRSVGRPDGI
jgi:hydroxymethylpyrimidine/phosphomethylpyrimidine kinase